MKKPVSTHAVFPFCRACGVSTQTQDALGNPLCETHRLRGLLIRYGVQNRWPAVHTGQFALWGGDQDLWTLPVYIGSDVMVEALARHLQLDEEDAS